MKLKNKKIKKQEIKKIKTIKEKIEDKEIETREVTFVGGNIQKLKEMIDLILEKNKELELRIEELETSSTTSSDIVNLSVTNKDNVAKLGNKKVVKK